MRQQSRASVEETANARPTGAQRPDRRRGFCRDGTTRHLPTAAQLVQLREGVGTSIAAADATYSYTANGKRNYLIDANGNRA
ncbi:MAG: hypothetical protein M3Q57_08910, partial [Pseudomonadota bacterium]|nr:hypothetical protein [Pseudomonadota bacterium]